MPSHWDVRQSGPKRCKRDGNQRKTSLAERKNTEKEEPGCGRRPAQFSYPCDAQVSVGRPEPNIVMSREPEDR